MRNIKQAEEFYRIGSKPIDNTILAELKANPDLIVHGGKAINALLPKWLDKATMDWDIFSSTPRATARKIEQLLDEQYNGNYFTVKPAKHEGTFRIISRVTERVVADITLPEREITYRNIKGVNYATLDYHVEQIKRVLADPAIAFRHTKDKETLQRIRIFRQVYPQTRKRAIKVRKVTARRTKTRTIPSISTLK